MLTPAASSSRRLRIAAIGLRGLPSAYSGLERSSEGLYAELARRGHEITVYCRPEYVPAPGATHRGIRLQSAPALKRRSLDTLSHVTASTLHALVRGRHDVIHLHALAPGLLAPLCRLAGVPVVGTVQGLDWQRAKWKGAGSAVLRRAERALVRNADEIIVVSRDLQAYFAETYGRATRWVPNGVEPVAAHSADDAAAHARALADLGLEPGSYVLFAGRLVPEKRVQDLITAFRAVPGPQRLAIAGEGGYTDGYVRELHELAAADPRITFTGFQSGTALEALFRNAAAYVLPSELEGLPMSLLECMQYGTPAIASGIPPHVELLGDVAGYDLFFPAGDAAALADRLQRVLSDPARYAPVAARAQDHVRRAHSWRAVADATEAVFDDVLSRRAASGGRIAALEPARQPR